MANPLASLARRIKPPQHRCPVCHERVEPGPGALRMRGDYYLHRGCASYRVRHLAAAREFTRS